MKQASNEQRREKLDNIFQTLPENKQFELLGYAVFMADTVQAEEVKKLPSKGQQRERRRK